MKIEVFQIMIIYTLSMSNVLAQYDFNGNKIFADDCEEHHNENFFEVSAYDVFKEQLIPGASVYEAIGCEKYKPIISDAQLEFIRDTLAANYDGAEIVGFKGAAYNCHAYAWHVSEGGEMIILNDFVDDYELFFGWNNRKITKIVGGSRVFPNAMKVTYPDNMNHSAITTLETDVFISKWGSDFFLIKHDWDQHVYGDCNYNELEFWGPTAFYHDIKEFYDLSYYLGTYIMGEDIHIEKVRIDLTRELGTNNDWFTFEFTDGIEIDGPFEVSEGSALTIQPVN